MSKKQRMIRLSTHDQEKLKKIMRAWRGKKILVVGDVGMDRYTMGSVERISPEAPVPIVMVEQEQHKLGLAANVADNVKALGGVPLLTGVVGDDRTGQDFKKLLRSDGIDSKYLVTDSKRRTVLKERIVSERQQLLRVDYESQNSVSSTIESKLIKQVQALASKADAVIVEDYAKGLVSKKLAQATFNVGKKTKKLVLVDPNQKTTVDTYVGASIFRPNKKEAEVLSGVKIIDTPSLKKAGQVLLKKTMAQYVVITLGKEGMALFKNGEPGGGCQLIPTFSREVYDVSGAGDTVISVLALALCAGATLEEAALLGNLAAGVVVGKRGTATASVAEITEAMEFFKKT